MNLTLADYLVPINEAEPCGSNLRGSSDFASPYYQLKNARTQARHAERQRLQSGETEVVIAAEWQPIAAQASTLIKEQSKDLEIASWLVEAWVRMHGLVGLSAGLNLLAGLVERFGASLTQEEADATELQLATVQGLSGEQQPGTLIMPLMFLPLTQGAGEDEFALWQYRQAVELVQLTDVQKREKRIADGGIALTQLQQAACSTDPHFSQALQQHLELAIAASASCDQIFSQRFNNAAPSWQHLKHTLDDMQQALQDLYRATPEKAEQPAHAAAASAQQVVQPSGDFAEREAALNAVARAADYFLRYEPHSPIAYSLQQIMHWAELSLPELMREIFPDMQTYYAYSRITGIPMPRRQSMEEDDPANEAEDD